MGPPSKPEDPTSTFRSHVGEVETDSHQLSSNLHALHPQPQPPTHTHSHPHTRTHTRSHPTPLLTPAHTPTHTCSHPHTPTHTHSHPTEWQEWFLSSPGLAKECFLSPPLSLLLPLCSSKNIEKLQLSRNGQRRDPIFLIWSTKLGKQLSSLMSSLNPGVGMSWDFDPAIWSTSLPPYLPWVFCLFVKWEYSPWWVGWGPAWLYSYGPACYPSYYCLRDWIRRTAGSRPA